jgi:hypothetical protein
MFPNPSTVSVVVVVAFVSRAKLLNVNVIWVVVLAPSPLLAATKVDP